LVGSVDVVRELVGGQGLMVWGERSSAGILRGVERAIVIVLEEPVREFILSMGISISDLWVFGIFLSF